jgi:dihydroxyacid dehydratase/phosphogluconate dehydratase
MKHNQSETPNGNLYDVSTHAPGPAGRLPLPAEWLRDTASGNVFGWTQDAAMGWSPDQLGKDEFLILSTQGGIRASDGSPIALGYHTGHWEVGLLAQAAAEELKRLGAIPFAGFVCVP